MTDKAINMLSLSKEERKEKVIEDLTRIYGPLAKTKLIDFLEFSFTTN